MAVRPSALWHCWTNPDTQLRGFDDDAVAALRLYLHARQTKRPTDIEAAASALRDTALHDGLDLDFAIEGLAALGHVDDAYEIVRLPKLDYLLYSSGASFLFEPVAAPLRADPRFWPLAADLGFAEFWVTRDKWPDFCGNEVPLATCKTESARALAAHRSG